MGASMIFRFLIVFLISFSIAESQYSFPHYSAKKSTTSGTPSYDNPMGMGDRQSSIAESDNGAFGTGGIAPIINGSRTDETTWFTSQTASGLEITFDFGAPQIITEITWYQSSTAEHGTWIIQAHNGGTWNDVGSSFTLGGATTQVITAPSSNTTGYRYYILVGLSGTTSDGPYIHEIEFKLVAE